MTPLFKNSIVLFGAKRKMLQDMEGLSTLVVGSSHGDFGFDPQYCPGSFNLCCRSQDLKHSLSLYKSICESVSTVRNLVVFYSVFSPGNFMERSPGERDICPPLNEIFGLGLVYDDSYLSGLSDLIRGKLDNVAIDIEGRAGFFPTTDKGFFPESYGAKQRAEDHLKLNRESGANVFLMDMLSVAGSLGHKVVIVVPPVRQDYKYAIGSDFGSVFGSLLSTLDGAIESNPELNVQLVNGYESDEFRDEFFGDFDHLLPTGEGVKILSLEVHEAISSALLF
ncbi:hypothetical protein D3C77_208650 [compost metagenome]